MKTELITHPPVRLPVITSPYGPRIDPITGEPGVMHDGIDFCSGLNTEVLCIADGIADSDFDNYLHKRRFLDRRHWSGNWISIMHNDELGRYWSLYVHLEKNIISRMDKLKKGQLVGNYANVGRATGPHLHFSIIKEIQGKWKRIDPEPFLCRAYK